MASKRERCSRCGLQLVVPPGAQTVRCPVCKTSTWVRTEDPVAQAYDSLRAATKLFKGFLSSVSSNIATSMNTSQGSGTSYNYGYYTQPPPQAIPAGLPMPRAHGRKRAVLCGVSYYGQRYKLKGSINDVRCLRFFLVEKLRFPSESILVLSEEERDPSRIPTKRNIRMALQWLLQGCESGDSLVFHFSGHGVQAPSVANDERDGYDESLCPVDFEAEGMIIDDEINGMIVKPLPRGAKLHAIIDACHSGTALDLPFLCRMNREGYYVWENHSSPFSGYKGTSGGLALCFSACDDHQTSADTTAFSGNQTSTGALTYSFIQAAQNEPGATYGRLLNAMRSTIRDAKTGIRLNTNGPISSLLGKIFLSGLSQEPQLSSSEKFDIYSTSFIL